MSESMSDKMPVGRIFFWDTLRSQAPFCGESKCKKNTNSSVIKSQVNGLIYVNTSIATCPQAGGSRSHTSFVQSLLRLWRACVFASHCGWHEAGELSWLGAPFGNQKNQWKNHPCIEIFEFWVFEFWDPCIDVLLSHYYRNLWGISQLLARMVAKSAKCTDW